ncbi:Fc.00g034270.m01.CDS01 [Cosmosporella sp. VM-42]
MSSPSSLIPLAKCHACKGSGVSYITYSPPCVTTGESLDLIKILVGAPPPGSEYKAVSHVWGPVQPIPMKCQLCSAVSTVMLKSKDTFDAIMRLVDGGSTIWIDNLFINQADHADVATQVAAIGKIYDGAKVFSVMLPPEDLDSFKCLSKVMELATLILEHRPVLESDAQQGPRDDGEWALARGIDVGVETATQRATLRNVKSTIIDVSILALQYKLRYAVYAGIDFGFSRDKAVVALEAVKPLFPCEARFLADDGKDAAEVVFQTRFSSFDSGQLLGI